MTTPYDIIKYAVKIAVVTDTLIYLPEKEIKEEVVDQQRKNIYYFFRSCRVTDYSISPEERIEKEYNNMINKSKAFNKLSTFISLIGSACIGHTADLIEEFYKDGKCDKINDYEFENTFERVKIDLIKEVV